MEKFNLIDSPWIPVRWTPEARGEIPAMVSIKDAFVRGQEIADLDCAPHERIAITRLLVCITHAALGAPEDSDEWHNFGQKMASEVPEYLLRTDIQPHFNLLGEGPRFLQSKPVEEQGTYALSKISFHLSSGNSPKLLDHWGEENRPWTPAPVALALLCMQNFFVGGSMAKKVKGNGPALKSLQMIICGENLREMIINNCLDKEILRSTGGDLGKPIWEKQPDKNLLARLAPTPCKLWLNESLQRIYIDQGFQYPEYEAYRDPFATTVTTRQDKRVLLRAKPTQGIWRDLHLLANLSKATGSNAPLNLQCLKNRLEHNETLKLWVGELIKAKDAKINDCTESTFTVPHSLFCDSGRNTYESGVHYADEISKKLYGAIKTCYSQQKHENPPVNQGQSHYWHILDQNHRLLISLASDPTARQGQSPFGDAEAKDEWTNLIREAALDAYNAVSPRTTPRQIQAYAAGYKTLNKALCPKTKAKSA
jgi:CRISPR system Cascade subunit CasA